MMLPCPQSALLAPRPHIFGMTAAPANVKKKETQVPPAWTAQTSPASCYRLFQWAQHAFWQASLVACHQANPEARPGLTRLSVQAHLLLSAAEPGWLPAPLQEHMEARIRVLEANLDARVVTVVNRASVEEVCEGGGMSHLKGVGWGCGTIKGRAQSTERVWAWVCSVWRHPPTLSAAGLDVRSQRKSCITTLMLP